jgi:hypothetical protein
MQHGRRWQAELCFFDPEDEALSSSETSADIQRNTWHYIPEDTTLHNRRCENIKSLSFLEFNFNSSVSKET